MTAFCTALWLAFIALVFIVRQPSATLSASASADLGITTPKGADAIKADDAQVLTA